jgi:hypothetical protein
MTFKDLEKPELLEVAEIFGVEVDKRHNEENLIAELLEEGITWEMYQEALNSGSTEVDEPLVEDAPEEEEEKPVPSTKRFNAKNAMELLKMERQNPTFYIAGYKFTKEHPFVLVTAEEALWIMANAQGFRIATPEEAEAFYK